MSRSAEVAADGGPQQDAGFSLLEVVVAIGVLMIVVVSLLPQLVIGIDATGTAQLVTQAKAVAQGQLEKMRNLPYYISPEAGDYRDVLDTYYRNRTAPTAGPGCIAASGGYAGPQTPTDRAAWTGFVSAGTRCDYEPPTGDFYRSVTAGPTSPGSPSTTVVVDTRFLSGVTAGQPLPPATTYNSQVVSRSQPASSQIGVTVTVLYRDRGVLRAASTSTQISDRPAATQRIRSEANSTAVEVGSETNANGPASLSAGELHLAGSLSYASTVNANLAGTSASLATGEQGGGATASVVAPPSTTSAAPLQGSGALTGIGCVIACWGSTRLDVAPMSADAALPVAGSQSAPMQSLLTDKVGNNGLSFGNSTILEYRPALRLDPPLVRLTSDAASAPSGVATGCRPGSTGTPAFVAAGGYLRATAVSDAASPSTVESCAVARTSTISLFPVRASLVAPTAPASPGIVVVELTQASARCTVSGTTHAASVAYDYSAVVKYWNGSGYQTLATIRPNQPDPLDAVNLATTSVGGGLFLGDFIASWSSLQTSEVTTTSAGGIAELKLPGVVTVVSKPTRPGATSGLDPTSAVSLTVGALGCVAEDAR